jgi:hypothetical protein
MSPIINPGVQVLLKLLIVLLVVFAYLFVARLLRGVPAKRRRRL